MSSRGAPSTDSMNHLSDSISERDWRRLYSRVIPNPVDLDAFKAAVCDGTLQHVLLARDLHHVMMELRDILHERGEIREAANLPLSGRKSEISRAAAVAIRVLHARAGPPPTAVGGAVVEAGLHMPPSPPLERSVASSTNEPQDVAAVLPVLQPLVFMHSYTAPSTETQGRGSAPEKAISGAPPSRVSWTSNNLLSAQIAHSAALAVETAAPTGAAMGVEQQQPSIPALGPSAPEQVPQATTSLAAPLADPPIMRSTGEQNEISIMNERAPPSLTICHIIKRFQLRYGSHPMRFEVPVQYSQSVGTRRLKVLVIPFKQPNLPARWPSAKEIVVYVNDQPMTTPWRRMWPERKEEVHKTYLPLDITQMLTRRSSGQRLLVDIYNREYVVSAMLVVAEPVAMEAVVERVLRDRLGTGVMEHLREALMRAGTVDSRVDPQPATALLNVAVQRNNEGVQRFYDSILSNDGDDDLEDVDDPIITTKCPISQMPIDIPVRGTHCRHLQCLDLHSLIVSCSKGSYWNCPLCDQVFRPSDVVVDTVFWARLEEMQRHCASHHGSMPPYFRLSIQDGNTPSRQCVWHGAESTLHRAPDADVIADTDDDEQDEQDAMGYSALPPASPLPVKRESDGALLDDDGSLERYPKRPRVEEPEEMMDGVGTADDPIEL